MSRAVMQMALDYIVATNSSSRFLLVPESNLNKTIAALKQALAEPQCMCREPWALGRVHREKTPCFDYVEPEQKPVAWVLVTPYGEEDDIFYTEPETVPDGWSYKPLYDAPTPRKPQPLTDEEIDQLLPEIVVGGTFTVITYGRAVARALERAHGITGDGQ